METGDVNVGGHGIRVVLLHRIDRNSSPNDWSLGVGGTRGDQRAPSHHRHNSADARSTNSRNSSSEAVLSPRKHSPCRKPVACLLRQASGRVYFVGKYRSGLKESSFSAWSVFQELVRQSLGLERTNKPLCIYSRKRQPSPLWKEQHQQEEQQVRDSTAETGREAASEPSPPVHASDPESDCQHQSHSAGVALLRSLSELLSQSEATVLQVAVSVNPLRRRVMRDLESAFGITPVHSNKNNLDDTDIAKNRPEKKSSGEKSDSAAGGGEVTSSISYSGSIRSCAVASDVCLRSASSRPAAVQEGAGDLAGAPGILRSLASKEPSPATSKPAVDQVSSAANSESGAATARGENLAEGCSVGVRGETRSIPLLLATGGCAAAVSDPSPGSDSYSCSDSYQESSSSKPRLVAQEAHRALMGLQTVAMASVDEVDSALSSTSYRPGQGRVPSTTRQTSSLKIVRSMSETQESNGSSAMMPLPRIDVVTTAEASSPARGGPSVKHREVRVEVTVDYRSKSGKGFLRRRSFRSKKVERRSISDLTNVTVSSAAHPAQTGSTASSTSVTGRQEVVVRSRPGQLAPGKVPERRWSSYVERTQSLALDSPTSPVHCPPAPTGLRARATPSETGCADLTWDPAKSRGEASRVLGYAVYLNSDLEMTVEGVDTCQAQLVELEVGKNYTISVKSRGLTEDSPPSRCAYTHHENSAEAPPAAAAAAVVASATKPECPTPSSDPPSRPLSSASTHSQNSVFAALRGRSKTVGSGAVANGNGTAGRPSPPPVPPRPSSATMAALQKELRSILTLSVSAGEERTPPTFGRSPSSSSSSSGISAGSWSSSPMHEVAASHHGGIRRNHFTTASYHGKSSAHTPSPFTATGPGLGPAIKTIDELREVLQKRSKEPVPLPQPASKPMTVRPRAMSSPADHSVPRGCANFLKTPSFCAELSPLSLEWDEAYDSYLSPAEFASMEAAADKSKVEPVHTGSWV